MIATWFLAGTLGLAPGPEGRAAAPTPPDASDRAAYEAARASAGRDADAQVRLALWCEARGMASEKTTHLTRAILLEPDHAKARGLLGYVEREGRWLRPSEASRAVEDSPEQRALLAEYLDRRAKTRDRSDDLYRLALWCEDKGLEEPMRAHLRRVVQLDPRREGAWRRLGCKKVGGRWVDPEAEAAAKAERVAQAKADEEWGPRLARIRSGLESRQGARRAEAEAALALGRVGRAVPSLWRAFAKGGDEGRQRLAAEAFGRIDGPGASLALATLALYSPHASIRTETATLLQRRDPREYAGFLAASIGDEVKYRVKQVDGPGTAGELLVEGEDANVRRIYRPMAPPALLPGDRVATGEDGSVVVSRPMGQAIVGNIISFDATALASFLMGTPGPLGWSGPLSHSPAGSNAPFLSGAMPPPDPALLTFDPIAGLPMMSGVPIAGGPVGVSTPRPGVAVAALERAGVSPGLSREVVGRIGNMDDAARSVMAGALTGNTLRPILQPTLEIPYQRMVAEAQMSALVARRQLAGDVAALESHNAPIREVNERAASILKSVSGEDRGHDRTKWMDWVIDLQGYGLPLRAQSQPPATVVEEVPIAFRPQAVPTPTDSVVGFRVGPSCFAGGTPVRTLRGDRPIEELRPGDQVLTQDTTTGAFSYKPVVEVFHNPPNATYAVDLGAETVHPTGIHRFWKAGRGWVMARDLEPGDRLRTVGGLVEVASVEKEGPRPVFNLLLAGGDNYCVGSLGVVAHDNGFVEPVTAPFDGVPETAELLARARP